MTRPHERGGDERRAHPSGQKDDRSESVILVVKSEASRRSPGRQNVRTVRYLSDRCVDCSQQALALVVSTGARRGNDRCERRSVGVTVLDVLVMITL